MKQNKDFNVRITVKFAEDYKINATSKEEAMKIAEDGYEGGLYDPHNHGEFFHEVEIIDNNELREKLYGPKGKSEALSENEIIEELNKVQSFLSKIQYPGYPFSFSVAIDFKNKLAYMGKDKLSFQEFNNWFNERIVYQALGCCKTQKGSFVQKSFMDTPKNIMKSEEEDFYIDNLNCAKLYFAFNSAIRQNQENPDRNYMFMYLDGESDTAEVKLFKDKIEVEKYIESDWKESIDELEPEVSDSNEMEM